IGNVRLPTMSGDKFRHGIAYRVSYSLDVVKVIPVVISRRHNLSVYDNVAIFLANILRSCNKKHVVWLDMTDLLKGQAFNGEIVVIDNESGKWFEPTLRPHEEPFCSQHIL